MTSLRDNPVDLTGSSDDDEVEFMGSATVSIPQMGTGNAVSTHDSKSSNQVKCTLPRADTSQATAKCNLIDSDWNGFGQTISKALGTARTPSPRSRRLGDSEQSTPKMDPTPNCPPTLQRKRIRGDSVSNPTKRSCNSPCNFTRSDELVDDVRDERADYDTYETSPAPRGRVPTEHELSHGSVILLDSDDDLDELIETSSRTWNSLSSRKSSRPLDPAGVLIDLDDEEDLLFEEIGKLDLPQPPPPGRSGTIMEIRNQAIDPPWVILPSEQTGLFTLKSGDVVVLRLGGFLMISIIVKNVQSGDVKLRGYRIDRSRELNGILPKKLNEVYLNLEIELDDHRPPIVQGMEEVALFEVTGVKKINVTNQVFPEASFRNDKSFNDRGDASHYGPCCLRWKHSVKFPTTRDRWYNKWTEQCIEHVREGDPWQDQSPEHFVDNAEVRSRFRGKTILGGSYDGYAIFVDPKHPTKSTPERGSAKPIIHIIDEDLGVEQVRRSVSIMEISEKNQNLPASARKRADARAGKQREQSDSSPFNFIDLSDSSLTLPPSDGSVKFSEGSGSRAAIRERRLCLMGQKYTYGDCFCGAGGSTRGALMAGFQIVWGFDQNKHACSTWRLNFPDATVYEEVADKFILRGRESNSFIVDVLHLSPPCQYFSPAHTVNGKDDEMNLASLFACGMLLDVAKPRIVTLEQTFGIVILPRFKLYFNALILMFTDRGFSVRWTCAQLQNWGLPQRRLRLIIFASCPGEALPEFPPFTHGHPDNKDGLPPWVSVGSAINNIPRDAPNHDLDLVASKRLTFPPYSDTSIAPRCITTHGGQNYHPCGKRGFTLREYACLQGFPMNHKFGAVNALKQIGNAVPPRIAKVLFSCVRKALEKADGIRLECNRSSTLQAGNFQTEAIPVD